MGSPIKLLKKGSAPSMIEAATANEVITKVNALLEMIVSPNGFGKFVVAEKDIKLDLGPLAKIIANLSKSGDSITATNSTGTGGGGSIQHPFQIQRVDDTTVNVRYGTLMDVEPTNVGTNLTPSGGTDTFYLEVEVDLDGAMVAVDLHHSTGGQPADTDYFGYITIGTVVSSGVITEINQAVTHSLRMSMCGRVVVDGDLEEAGTYEFWGI